MSIIAGGADEFEFSTINIPPNVDSVAGIVQFLIQELVQAGKLPHVPSDQLTEEVLHREALGATAIGRGVATPNARTDLIEAPIFAIGQCAHPVIWPNAIDGRPASVVCLFITPDSSELHQKVLEAVARRIRTLSN